MLNHVETTRLSSNGKIILPEAICDLHQWQSGQEFIVEDTGDGVLIRPVASALPRTTVADVAGFLKYEGAPISIEEMDEEINNAIREQWRDSD